MPKKKFTINEDFVAALDKLKNDWRRTNPGYNDSTLAHDLRATPGLVHAWRIGRSDPTPRRAVQLARLDASANGSEIKDLALNKWLQFARRNLKEGEFEQLLEQEKIVPVPGFRELVEASLEPLMSLGIREEEELLDMAVCRLSQRASESRRQKFLNKFRSGTVVFVWTGWDIETIYRRFDSDEFAKWVIEFLSPPQGDVGKGLGSKSSDINVVGFIMLNSVPTGPVKKELVAKGLVLFDKVNAGVAAVGRFSVYLENKTTPISQDYWFYGGPGQIRGTVTLDSPDLEKLIDEAGGDPLKRDKYKFSNLIFELSQKQVDNLIAHHRIERKQGRLLPIIEDREVIFPIASKKNKTVK